MHTRLRTRLVLCIFNVFLLIAPSAVHAALSCQATPGGEGNATASGTPTPLRYYQPSASASAGASTISVTNTTGLAAGNMVLVIQMQGAAINATNTLSYGNGVNSSPAAGYLNDSNLIAGNYEYAAVASTTGTSITLTSPLINSYVRADATTSAGRKRYQVIRVPQYENLTLTGTLTAPAWDGETGGVLALDVSRTLAFSGNSIDMNGKGFRGGRALNHTGITGYANTDYRNVSSNTATGAHSSKGEGIAGTPRYVYNGTTTVSYTDEGYPNGSYGMGAPGTAGGGGTDGNPASNDQNSGGGGGGNGGAGGRGGNSWSSNLAIGGFGGAAFGVVAPSRIVMGGGAGAGTVNNSPATAPHGGVGGGIVLIRADQITGTGVINANGGNGNSPLSPTNDAAGGGGAGGSVVLLANGSTGSITVNANGGNGGNSDPGGAAHGPGGGGGGGVVYSNSAITITGNTAQGASGYTVSAGNYFGASPSGGDVGSKVPNTDPSLINGNSPGADCTVIADIAIVKSLYSPVLQAGSAADFLIKVTNNGPNTTTAPIVVTDVLNSVFSYTGFTGTGWSCVQSPAQTITCTHNGPLAVSASLPDLFINVNIAASPASSSVSNTATVDFNNSGAAKTFDNTLANNSSTINDTIYGVTVSGNKQLYTYPAVPNLQRVVPPNTATTGTITSGNNMQLNLSPALTGNLIISGNLVASLCMRASGSSTGSNRSTTVSMWRGATQIGTNTSINISGTGWTVRTFTIAHTGPTTVTSGTALQLRIANGGSSGRSIDLSSTNCNTGVNASRVTFNTSTVINVSNVQVYSAASPAGSLVTSAVEGTTVYVRSTVTDPFGHADINNDSTVEVRDTSNNLISGPHNDTAIISQTGNTKVFEYAVTMPPAWEDGPYVLRVRANEGTEGTITHYNATAITLTGPPLLMVSKLASQTTASPGNDINYTVLVSNTHVLGTGNATGVMVSDQLPPFTAFKLGSIAFTDGAISYALSTLSMGTVQYSNNNGTSWVYVPTSGGGGAPAGYDKNVTNFRIPFTGSMPLGSAFTLNYVLKVN